MTLWREGFLGVLRVAEERRRCLRARVMWQWKAAQLVPIGAKQQQFPATRAHDLSFFRSPFRAAFGLEHTEWKYGFASSSESLCGGGGRRCHRCVERGAGGRLSSSRGRRLFEGG